MWVTDPKPDIFIIASKLTEPILYLLPDSVLRVCKWELSLSLLRLGGGCGSVVKVSTENRGTHHF